MMWTTLFAALFLSLPGIHGAFNITVDNTDTSISYTGLWSVISMGGYDYNGTQNLVDLGPNVDRPGADSTATFVFTGIAVYYKSPLWPFRVDTVVTLDDDPSVVVDMTAPGPLVPSGSSGATVVSSVLWGRTGLNDTQHKLVMSRAAGGRFVIVDALIYTQDSQATSASPMPPNQHPMTRRTTLIAVACSLTSIIILAIVTAIIFVIARARRQRQPQDPGTVAYPTVSPFPPHVNQASSPAVPTDKGTRMYGQPFPMSNITSGSSGQMASTPRALHAASEPANLALSEEPPPYDPYELQD